MTKSTITREQLEEWVAQFDVDGGCDATDRQLEALIRQSLAAMLQTEPVTTTSKLPGVIDDNLVEGLRLLQCMLDDYRERNYGHAQDWVRHIDQRFSEHSEAHGDDAYCILHRLLAGEGDSNSPAIPDGSAVAALTGIPMIPDGYVMVPKEPTEEMLQASYREAAVYSPTAYRAMIAAAPQEAINALIPLASRNEQEGK